MNLTKIKHNGWLVFVSAILMHQFAIAENTLKVLYSDRPPFMTKLPNGTLTGLAATPAILAFAKAAIAIEIVEASPARRIQDIKENNERVCSLGLYKNPERQAFAKFSNPVSQDGKMIVLANPKLHLPKAISVDTLLDQSDVKILIKKNIFYGPFLEEKFAKMKAQRIDSTAEYAQLIRLIKLDRAQLIFLPEEEVRFYLKEFGYSASDFNVIKFAEMPAGEFRHIMCSLKVEESVMERLNKAIGNVKHVD